MENFRLMQDPEQVPSSPAVCCSLPSSLQDVPLMEQSSPTMSANQVSIGSSSDFHVAPLVFRGNRLSTVQDVPEPSQPSSATGNNTPVPGNPGVWNEEDPPIELPDIMRWVRGRTVMDLYDPELNYDTDDVLYSDGGFDGTLSESIGSNEMVDEVSPHTESTDSTIEEADEVSPQMESADSTIAEADEESSRPSLASSHKTVPFPALDGDDEPPEEEKLRLRHMANPAGSKWEVLDLDKVGRARLYNYHISRIQKLRILCAQSKSMTDLAVNTEDDYELLRTLTTTSGDLRWWTILIDDLVCPECVLLLRASRHAQISKPQRLWLRVKRKIRGVCLCRDNCHDFTCNHLRPEMNRVTRFFNTLGRKNASRMANIELDTTPGFPVDLDVLASAVYNAALYFPNPQRISVRFHLSEGEQMDRDRIEVIVCCLAKLEESLPWACRLHVAGLEYQERFLRRWNKNSRARKWWMN